MKIVLLNTFHLTGGAAIAANRLNKALNKSGTERTGPIGSVLLTGTPTWLDVKQPDVNVQSLANSFWSDKTALARMVAERYYFIMNERDSSVRTQFSPGLTGIDLTDHPLINQADILHLHWINLGLLSMKSIQKLAALNKPIVWTMHDMWAFTGGCHYAHECSKYKTECSRCPFLRRPGPHDLSYRNFHQKKEIFAQIGHQLQFVAPSQWLASEASASALFKGQSVRVIPNPIDTTIFAPMAKAEANARFGLPRFEGIRLLFGSLNLAEPRKGFHLFADALRQLKEIHPDAPLELLLMGNGTPAVATGFPVRKLGMLKNEQQLVAAYNAADLTIVPSLEDNLPNTIVESMACGTPVVGFPTGGIPNMITNMVDGYLTADSTPQSLLDTLLTLLKKPSQLPALSEAARQRAVQQYTDTTVASSYINLYEELLAARTK